MQYINPYILLEFNSENVSDANAHTIKVAKRKLLLEIELNDNETIECCGFSLTKSTCLTIINELDNYDKNYFHLVIAQDLLLNDFLTTGNIKYFQQYKRNPIYNQKEFVDFISPYFAFQYDKLLVGYFKTNNTKIVKIILSIDPISNDGYSEKCFKSTYAFLIKANTEIEKIITDIEANISSFIVQDFRGLSQTITENVNIQLLNILPAYFQGIRNKIGKTINRLSTTINNKPYHSYQAAFQIIEVARNILTNGLIFEKITKSYNIIKSNSESIKLKQEEKANNKQTVKGTPKKVKPKNDESQFFEYEQIETEINKGENLGTTPFWIAGGILVLLLFFLFGSLYFEEREIKIKKHTEKYYFQKGFSYFTKKNYNDAIIQYDKAINIDSSYADAYENRGKSKARLGEYEAAIIDYLKAEENGLRISTLYSDLGYAYYKREQLENAISNFEKAIIIDSTNADAFRYKGEIEYQNKNYKSAEKDYSKSIKYDPCASNYFNRGLSLYYQKKYKRAIQDIDVSIELDPNVAQFYYIRGAAKSKISDNDGACHDWIIANEKGYSVPENELNNCIPHVVSMSNGNIFGCDVRPRYASPSIDNFLRIKVGNTDVVVKLINANGGSCIRYVFINQHTTYNITNIPEGKYYLKIAYGKNWAKTARQINCQGRFTKNTLFEKGDEIMDFNLIENYNGWQVPSFELVLNVIITEDRQNFNQFNSSNISENDFYNN